VLRFTSLNALLGGEVSLQLTRDPTLVLALLGLAVGLSLLSGGYPALYLSSWAPVSALTAQGGTGNLSRRLREGLVLLQLTISTAVIACTLLMSEQMRYVVSRSLGFQKENRLVVTLRGADTIEKLPAIRAQLAKDPHVLGVTEAQTVMGQETPINLIRVEGDDGVLRFSETTHMPISQDFVKVMGLRLLQGRDFSGQVKTDADESILVNEALVRKMGWKQPLGKHVWIGGRGGGHVIGVVQDFNFKSLHWQIEPFLMYPLSDDFSDLTPVVRRLQLRLMIVSISATDVEQTVAHIQQAMSRIDPRHPVECAFLDSSLQRLYSSDYRLLRLIALFAAVCIFIACLGLFGLTAFTTEQRSREIAIRKALGASAFEIIMLLSRRILALVLVAAVLASIIAYLVMSKWLAGFAYRTEINPLTFVASATAAALLAFTTVAVQAYRSASADPAQAVRQS